LEVCPRGCRPYWGTSQRSPDPLGGYDGKGREKRREEMVREGKGRERERIGRGRKRVSRYAHLLVQSDASVLFSQL